MHDASATSPRPPDELRRTMGWRPRTRLPASPASRRRASSPQRAPGTPSRLVLARPRRRSRVAASSASATDSSTPPTVGRKSSRSRVSSRRRCAVGDRLSPYPVVSVPPGWCSWSAYFSHVTEADVLENAEAALYSRSRLRSSSSTTATRPVSATTRARLTGGRHANRSPVEAYREELRLIRLARRRRAADAVGQALRRS